MGFRVGDDLSISYKHETFSEPPSVYNIVAHPT